MIIEKLSQYIFFQSIWVKDMEKNCLNLLFWNLKRKDTKKYFYGFWNIDDNIVVRCFMK